MDGDGQNDPADIPRLLEQRPAGCDLVAGWRGDRQDPWLLRGDLARSLRRRFGQRPAAGESDTRRSVNSPVNPG